MVDFSFLKNELTKKWVINAPRRAHRTNLDTQVPICPFCLGNEKEDHEVYRSGGTKGDSNWKIRVVKNKFPFTPYHEVIIHSPDHHKNFDELPFAQVKLILETYKKRYILHQKNGQVYIFHNSGRAAGESLPHPHSQLTVIDPSITSVPPLAFVYGAVSRFRGIGRLGRQVIAEKNDSIDTEYFYVFCPQTSEWPDEVWIAPQLKGLHFGDSTESHITDLAFVLTRIIHIYSLRYGHEFPFNFYIYPGINWYLRLIPRVKILGGFELGTGIMVNTQEPQKTLAFIKEHFWEPDYEKIRLEHQADYWRRL